MESVSDEEGGGAALEATNHRKPQGVQGAQRTMERAPLTEKVIGCAIEVHRYLGPGLFESAYESMHIGIKH